jgi:hypothetical protein
MAARGLLGPPPPPPPGRPSPIAYLGSSVTVQRHGYRPLLHAALCRESGRPHPPVFAGVGGVGAISGLFLLDDLVLRHRPAVCWIEFGPTDMAGDTPPDLLPAVLEAMVLRLREHECEPAFLLLPRFAATPLRDSTVAAYNEVAADHEVVCVDLVEQLEGDPAMFRDHVHSSPEGAQRIATAASAAIDPSAPPRPPGRARREPSFLEAALLAPGGEHSGTLGDLFPYVALGPDERLTLTPERELHGLVVAVGPSSGAVEITGGGPPERHLVWDEWCYYDRLSTLVFTSPRPAGSEVVIQARAADVDASRLARPLAEPLPAEQRLRLIAFMIR